MGMELVIVLFIVVVGGLLAARYGADSRIDDVDRRQHYVA
jgi:hypothetical protein